MMERPVGRRQLDLLVRAANALELQTEYHHRFGWK
jgi:hypothetical protein